MLKQFALTENSDAANWAAWTCTLTPNAVDDWAPALQLAEKAIRIDPKNCGYLCTQGALLYSAGRFSEAIQRLEEVSATWEQATTKPPTYSPAYNWFFLAMAHRCQGNEENARRWLDKAVTWAEQEMKNQVPWNRRLTVELLRREAEALLKPDEK